MTYVVYGEIGYGQGMGRRSTRLKEQQMSCRVAIVLCALLVGACGTAINPKSGKMGLTTASPVGINIPQ